MLATSRRLLMLGLPALLLGTPALADDDEKASLPAVVVTATRSEKSIDDTPIRTEVVDRSEIERMHARTLGEALENIPGLQLREIHGKSGYEVSLQGLTSDQVLVLVDGLPITPSTGSTIDLSQYLLSEVERIEVVKGAASAQYGSSAMGGVVNVITRRIQPGFSGSVAADIGSRGKQNPSGRTLDAANRHAQFNLQGGSERWRLRLDGDVLQDDGFTADINAWPRQGDKVRREQFGARAEFVPNSRSRLWIDGSTYREHAAQRFEYFAPPNYVPQAKNESITRNRLGLGGHWTSASGLRAELKAVEERYDSDSDGFSNSVLIRSRQSAQRMTHVTGQLDLPPWKRQLWQLGFDWHRETLDQRQNGESEIGGGIGSAQRSSKEVFLQNDILLDDTWEVLFGMRWQSDSDFGSHAVPKVALRANLLQGSDWTGSLQASYGRGYRVPNLKERHYLFDHSSLGYVVIGNPNLRPEESDSIQVGGKIDFRNRVSLELNAFYNRVDNLIQIDERNATIDKGITVFTYRNISRARTQGLETALNWRATPELNLSAGYTLTSTSDLDTGSELTRRPRHIARLGLDWKAQPATTLSLRGRYQSSELVDSIAQGRSPAWATMDVAVNHRIGRSTTAFAGVDNVFDRQRDFGNATDFGPLAGRYFYVGIRHEFGNNK